MRTLLFFGFVCLVVFALDLILGAQVSPWSLYLLPVLAAGWLFGGQAALAVAAFSAALILLAALLAGHPFTTWFDFGLSWSNRAASLLVVAWLVGLARRASENQSIKE
jgi:hypothetical protein